MDARSLVFRAGDQIFGQGRLVRTGEGDWFDPPQPVPAIYYRNGPPAPRPSSFRTPVEGADFDAVERRYERDGAVEGYATIYGTWLGDRIRIERQTGEQLDRRIFSQLGDGSGVPSRWTRAELDNARRRLTAMQERWRVYLHGEGRDEHGRPFVMVELVRVTDEIAAWVERLPAGLVSLDPCLKPVRFADQATSGQGAARSTSS